MTIMESTQTTVRADYQVDETSLNKIIRAFFDVQPNQTIVIEWQGDYFKGCEVQITTVMQSGEFEVDESRIESMLRRMKGSK